MTDPMADFETRLRNLMDIAADVPYRQIKSETVWRGVLRRRQVAAAAATAAVLVVGGIGVALAGQRAGHAPGPAPGTPSPSAVAPSLSSGVPGFYIVRSSTARGDHTTVRATATGAVRATIRCPGGAANVRPWPVASAGAGTFFVVCQRATGPDQSAPVRESDIYRIRLTSTGHVRSFALVRGGSLAGRRVQGIAVTPGGSEIAVMT